MQLHSLAHVQSPLRDAITSAYRRDEQECVQTLLPWAQMDEVELASTRELARRLVSQVRQQRTRSSGVDALMHEFSLSSQEGIALMCLAEALLRIPDRETADKLIRDKISKGDWKSHVGNSASLFVNAAAWGLLVTGKLVSSHSANGLSSALTRLIAKGGEPLIRKGVDMAMRMLGKQFVTGETIDEALANGREREARGYRFSYDMLGEAAMTEADAQRYLADYEMAIHAIGRASAGRGVYEGPGISVKLSAIHPRYSRMKHERMMGELLPRLKALFMLAKQYDIGLNIDAEEADRLEVSLDLIEALAHDPDLDGFKGIGIVVQAYQKRCPYVIDFLIDLARKTGHRFMVRLVKGAYWDAEIKRAQVDGLPGYPVYTRKVYTDVSYLACAKKLLGAQDAIYPQFATHNAYSLSAIYQLGQGKDYEFQCLHGMGETLYDQVVGAAQMGKACRIYAPVGSHETLLAYLVRRLLENGANSSFVNRIVDEAVSIESLLEDPVAVAAGYAGVPHSKISLPADLYGIERKNSKGLDLSSEHVLSTLQIGLQSAEQANWQAMPLLADGVYEGTETVDVINPADSSDVVGKVVFASAADASRAVTLAVEAVAEWGAVSASERAGYLRKAADLMEEHMVALMALAVREAGKTLNNAIAEVREAVDFCRYYAAQVDAEFSSRDIQPLGPVVCISPWNFPLAIFMGEVVAALAAGNTVLAKPAEQTSLIAAMAVKLLHDAGVPKNVLQLLPGRGETVGAVLTSDDRVKGVIFTGSTEVAQLINRALSQRDEEAVLVAETGGQNAMIVDSSALPEQVVTDVLSSAFDSAGQRCSALRVLYLQTDIADKVVTMLKGAMQELKVGNPAHFDTDIGPVIDAEAWGNLQNHVDYLKPRAKSVFQVELGPECKQGTFIAPTLFEIASLADLKREVFGPILHVLRFDAADIDQVVAEINSTGYGLTHGIHSRIDETIDAIAGQVKAGNVYVNRNIVGAVVGVQPFGGEGKSGTGPKAGGPFYAHRLTRSALSPRLETEQVVGEASGLNAIVAHVQGKPAAGVVNHIAEKLKAVSLLSCQVTLPGPTGERNVLRFAPKGKVVCQAGSEAALIEQLLSVVVTGNVPVLPQGNAMVAAVVEQLGVRVVWEKAPCSSEIDAVLFDGEHGEWRALREQLAKREGALVPVVTRAEDGYPLHRLMVERAVSINTTAAGGNASLMSMAE